MTNEQRDITNGRFRSLSRRVLTHQMAGIATTLREMAEEDELITSQALTTQRKSATHKEEVPAK